MYLEERSVNKAELPLQRIDTLAQKSAGVRDSSITELYTGVSRPQRAVVWQDFHSNFISKTHRSH